MKILVYVLVIIHLVSCNKDSFTEELLLKPLYANKLYSHFQFTTKWDVDATSDSMFHTNLFPRAISEIVVRHNIQELHISLTAGLWRYETWGYPVVDAAPGAEVWAWFNPDTENVDKNWKELANSLSGLLCASLNFIDSTNSINPEISLRNSGVVQGQVNNTFLRYSSLPREIVCTENLTPWKKLLPCSSKAGIASLLNAGYIHNTQYHSVGIMFRPICADKACTRKAVELQQTVSLVYDYKMLGNRQWTLRRLFGQGIMNACPLAKESSIYVDLSNDDKFDLEPYPHEYITAYRGGYETTYAKYDIKRIKPMSIAASYEGKEIINVNIPPPLYASQYKTGFGQQNGGIITKLYNNHWADLNVVVLQNFPWYVPIYLHTMKIESNGNILQPTVLKYKPGKLREKAHYLEIGLRLPPKSTISISIDFDYVFLKWQEYPPDANHGFYIGSAIISAMLPLAKNYTGIPQDGSTIADSFNASRSGYLVQIRTETMIITLPTPDFSMPYNVICLACTVVALAFGPLHNITTKRLILKVTTKKKLSEKLKSFFKK
ncbi:PREDICTED: GPI transamidase component PIG-T [Nicrophorus vespilloides]|uniref:GPI transamidase component PIG-T n=1 Tax=Nicrophorus vespilloides TaxID=110193 RepID=A0ABM1ND22_NICVS|nr:PREDICTED: GPI transamidase component PIG-T [Nicrophorus vespilloides]